MDSPGDRPRDQGPAEKAGLPWLVRAREDIGANLRFFSRLPLGPQPADAPPFDFGRIAWATPLAGAAIGAGGAGALACAVGLGLPPAVASILATAALIAIAGGLHEDGLADMADGFGGGATQQRKLEIMRDSRIGAYGALALALSLMLRVAALQTWLAAGLWPASAAMILCAALSRVGALAPLAYLPPARADGVGAAAGRLDLAAFAAAAIVALLLAVLAGLAALGLGRALLAAVGAAAGAAAVCALAKRQIGGQTGDVAGAAQQAGEIGAWCALLIGEPIS